MQKGRFALTPEIQLRALAGKELNVRARCVRPHVPTHAQQFEPMIDVSAVWRSEPQERRLFWDQEVPLLGPGGARVLLGSALLSAQMVQVRCWALFAS